MECFTPRLQNLKYCVNGLNAEDMKTFELPVDNKILISKFKINNDKMKLYCVFKGNIIECVIMEYPFVKYGEKIEVLFDPKEWDAVKNVLKNILVRDWIMAFYYLVLNQLYLKNIIK